MNGANAERVSNSKELFYLLLDTLKDSDLYQRYELGGHSPVWAKRAQMEGCKVFIAAQTTKVTEKDMPFTEVASGKYLLWPK